MATDEYFTGITRYIPAQTSDVFHLVNESDVKSPLQILPMHFFAQLGLKLGIEHPYLQYRFSLSALAVLNALLLGWVFLNYNGSENKNLKGVRFLLFGFFFLAPFAFTRPMFESLAAPWIALAALYGSRYDHFERRRDLLWGVLYVSIAFVMRQQVGICALALILLPLLKKKISDLAIASLVGITFFLLLGLPDYFLRGGFHHSLISIFKYNLQYGASYATHPIYTYPVLIFALCFGPWWIMQYPQGFWKNHFRNYRAEWLMLLFFVGLHSSFPQKWERFLISMIPIFIILLSPLVLYLIENSKQRVYRALSLAVVNFLFFIPATFFPPQKNLILLSQYIDEHPSIKTVIRVDNTPEWITDAFIRNPHFAYREITSAELAQATSESCSDILVVAKNLSDQVNSKNWIYKTTLNVNVIETVAFKLNPAKNIRRAPLLIFVSPNNCIY